MSCSINNYNSDSSVLVDVTCYHGKISCYDNMSATLNVAVKWHGMYVRRYSMILSEQLDIAEAPDLKLISLARSKFFQKYQEL